MVITYIFIDVTITIIVSPTYYHRYQYPHNCLNIIIPAPKQGVGAQINFNHPYTPHSPPHSFPPFSPSFLLSPAATCPFLQRLKLVMDSIIWAFRHTERNVAETGLNLLQELLSNFTVRKKNK